MNRSPPALDRFLQPVAGEFPCGPELDYDGDFIALEQRMLGSPERQYGDTIIPAEPPDFSEVVNNALALLDRSRDLRVAVLLTRGLARTCGAAGAVAGVQLLLRLTSERWDSLHPQLIVDGEEDPLPRANAFATIAAGEGLLGDLRSLRLQTRLVGAIELGELERAAGGREGGPVSRSQLQQMLRDEAAAGNPELAALSALTPLVRALGLELRQRLGVENAPDFKPLLGLLDASTPPQLDPDAEISPEHDFEAGSSAAAASGSGGLSALRTRQDAIAALEAVCQFLERQEPANPAPMLIRRASRLIGQDFLSILRELAPDGVGQAEHAAGLRQ
jgi:type VI secretion system protein ImpA